jgi:Kef-type K+ transport system membrane component KefB
MAVGLARIEPGAQIGPAADRTRFAAFEAHRSDSVLLVPGRRRLIEVEVGNLAAPLFPAGLILREEYFGRSQEPGSFDDTKRIVDNVAFSWIGPVFFVDLGTKIVFEGGVLASVLPHIAALVAAIFVSQIASAGLAARYTSGMDWRGSVMIGFGMLGRAELAFVVMDIAYVQNAILTTEAFYTLMGTAFVLNILVPITIRLWKPVYEAGLEPTTD